MMMIKKTLQQKFRNISQLLIEKKIDKKLEIFHKLRENFQMRMQKRSKNCVNIPII